MVGDTPRRILELGAGTGIFTRVLLASGHKVVAVEPDAEMRARLLARSPGVETCRGEAEAIPLPDASVDAVVCAQAHWWFDPERAYREIARVIRPGGVFGAIWNVPDSRNPLAAELNAIEGGGAPVDVPEPALGARFSSLEATSFPHAATYTHETLLSLVKSRASFIAAAPELQQEIERAVARLAATVSDPFELPYLAVARRAVRLD
jgi:SAM-dependent methyltransferase